VEYERHGIIRKARATKEVILSAGVIGSPKILMLSGIGPRKHLESLGVRRKKKDNNIIKNVCTKTQLYL
jgi:choline dehydrogenase-like flavoprotein